MAGVDFSRAYADASSVLYVVHLPALIPPGDQAQIGPDGAVTLPYEERERSTPNGFSSRRDGLAPRGHRCGA
jgi:hypothetical protein